MTKHRARTSRKPNDRLDPLTPKSCLTRQPARRTREAEAGRLFSRPAPRCANIWEMIVQVAPTTATALIRGESGVGKDLVARAIHAMSPRVDGPFVKVNCAALPASAPGVGAVRSREGGLHGRVPPKARPVRVRATRGRSASTRSVSYPRELQAKLLHVIQDLQFSRVGGRESIRADVRIVATTNRDLEAAMSARRVREDLYYRLNVVEIMVPPLRERREAIPFLVESFLRRFNLEYEP